MAPALARLREIRSKVANNNQVFTRSFIRRRIPLTYPVPMRERWVAGWDTVHDLSKRWSNWGGVEQDFKLSYECRPFFFVFMQYIVANTNLSRTMSVFRERATLSRPI